MKRGALAFLTAVWCVGGISTAQGHSATTTAAKPNIIIIFNDDQGYQDLGCFDSPDIKTPNVDRLARNGMRFTDFYVAASVCNASRAALMTGLYPKNANAKNVYWPNRGDNGLNPAYVTMAETLKSAGYATSAVGNWPKAASISLRLSPRHPNAVRREPPS